MATTIVKKSSKSRHSMASLSFARGYGPRSGKPFEYWHIENPPTDPAKAQAMGRTLAAEYLRFVAQRGEGYLGSIFADMERSPDSLDVQCGFVTMIDKYLVNLARGCDVRRMAEQENTFWKGVLDRAEREAVHEVGPKWQ